ncbi:sensor histidine kinase [Evansella sp. AB-P1]|uniref:sensor histidine kinase n=1 Tax=Evansella sp. AB-P1 TaxID=3037653 RepID=UPI00241FB456|nr:sensor histidine kinase [Evansella sp. AB-P1]MDG5786164.1 sensor histidine kinase [Evansella sp. AB-P1]
MPEKQVKLVEIILYSTIFGSLFLLLGDNPNDRLPLILLILSYATIQFFRYNKYKIPLLRPISILLIIVQVGIAFFVQAIDGTFLPQVFFFILIAEIGFRSKKIISIPFTFICYFTYIGALIYHFQFPPFHEISYVIPRSIEYILFWGFSYIARFAVLQKEELEITNKDLQEATNRLKEKTMLQERLRLSKEIHDTVGHTLTTALFGIEASKHVLKNGSLEEGLNQLDKSTVQIKRSLEDVRSIVHSMNENQNFVNIRESIIKLIQETEDGSSVSITYDIDESLPQLSPDQELAIYRSLQEGITNGIKHGKSNKFFYQLLYRGEELQITLEDNGYFDDTSLEAGFGLKAMKNRFQLIGGSINITKNKAGGCTLKLVLPIGGKGEEREGEEIYNVESNYR